jgi:hypothetical protein
MQVSQAVKARLARRARCVRRSQTLRCRSSAFEAFTTTNAGRFHPGPSRWRGLGHVDETFANARATVDVTRLPVPMKFLTGKGFLSLR